jgi:glycosyltransferase involved in cell wall biosynthesis
VRLVVPAGIGDGERVSGGNLCDLRVGEELAELGWDVRMAPVDPDAAADAFADVPDDGLVLVDGLVAGRSAEAVESEAARLRIVVLAHMVSAAFAHADPRFVEGERRAFGAASAVVTTSEWTRSEIVGAGLVEPARVVVARPGTDAAAEARGTPEGASVVCVGVVAPHKGQDVLVAALAELGAEPRWTCTIAGSLETRPRFVRRVSERVRDAGLGDQVSLAGVLGRSALDDVYRDADLLVAPSRVESYGMAIAEALRRGIPVLASDVGGIPEAVGDGSAAILVPPGDADALGAALTRWLADPALRARLTSAARRGRDSMPHWNETARRVASVLEEAR